jgi:hypothetical protein
MISPRNNSYVKIDKNELKIKPLSLEFERKEDQESGSLNDKDFVVKKI